MGMEISNAYRLGQQIGSTQDDTNATKRELRYTRIGLKLMFATTLLMYFIFSMGFYVADAFGLVSWLEQHANERFAFVLFLTMAILMAVSLAMTKHIFYEHRASFRMNIAPVILMASLGVFFEMFNSSSQQQNIAYDHAENSRSFSSIANTQITVGGGSGGQLASDRGELAKYQSYLQGCKSTCGAQRAKVAEYRAKVAADEESDLNAAAATATATSSALHEKAAALQDLKEDNIKPVFKAVRDALKVKIAIALALVTLLVSAGFEYAHATLSRVLSEKLAKQAGLREQLIRQESDYMELTGKMHAPGDFAAFGEGDVPRPARPEPDFSGASAAPALFKWKARLRPLAESVAIEFGRAQYAREQLNNGIVETIGKLSRPAPPTPVAVPDTAPALPETPTVHGAVRAGADIYQGKNQAPDDQSGIPADPAVAADLPLPVDLLSQTGLQKPAHEVYEPQTGPQKQVYEDMGKKVAMLEQKLSAQRAEMEAKAAADLLAAEQEAADRTAMEASYQAKLDAETAGRKRVEMERAAAVRSAKETADRTAEARALADRLAAEKRAAADRTAEAEAAAKAAADLQAAEQEAADRAERGTLTDGQIGLAANVIRNAVTAGHITTLGHPSTSPILKAAGLPTSTTSLKALNKLACKVLEAEGLVILNPNKSRGQSLYIIA